MHHNSFRSGLIRHADFVTGKREQGQVINTAL